MEWFVRAFLKASVSWLAVGVTLGVVMIAYPSWIAYRPAHMHINLLGFVAMMIFGVGYHVIPRFSGAPLHARHLARGHWWVANIGLLLLVFGFVLRAIGTVPTAVAVTALATGGTLSAMGAYVFAYNIWRTIDAGVAAQVHRKVVTSDAPIVRVARRR